MKIIGKRVFNKLNKVIDKLLYFEKSMDILQDDNKELMSKTIDLLFELETMLEEYNDKLAKTKTKT